MSVAGRQAGRPRGHADVPAIPPRGGTEVLLKPSLAAFHFPSPASHTQMLPAVFTRGPQPNHHSRWAIGFLFHFLLSVFFFFLNTTWALSFAFLSSDEIWPMLADTKGQWEHVHYKSNYLERFPIRPQKTGFIHVSSGLQKSIKFMFRFRSSGKFLLEICLTAQWNHQA